ncbi:molybdenum ABC transporter ATP-binding protein [Methylomonas sp. EFPC3]|uniref:molybdenum ABC transporter ATP-binding protein n=1 Tax=unclassified Methylomonas TaxID=2608980 RepID=UPI002416DE66|nr:molybdenum ABC transporter ATP-binding protein [Methylomonas sp. EFPC3]WFP50128.1 molybdenum ABC transporter ATP-binding protein [Methylomonas sp. EFPC3]
MNASELIARFQLNYGGFALDVDLNLPAAGVTVFYGHSGSGKTTLLRCIAGLEQAPQGYLRVGDTLWQDSERGLFLPTHRRNLGYVFQDANLFPHLSVRGNLDYAVRRMRCREGKISLEQAIELLAIAPLLARMPGRLSGGERQRVAIARALAASPDILLMDEPLAALDEERKQEFLPYLTGLQQNLRIPILYVTHSRHEVNRLADHLLVMAAGKAVACGPLAETLTRLDGPLAADRMAASVWQGRLVSHEADYHLSHAEFAGGNLSLPYLDAAPGSPVRIRIYARDVSIALQPPQASSILNILPAEVRAVADLGQGQSVVQLAAGGEILLSHITQKSAALLNLRPGMPVFAQIKGTSIVG